MRRGLVLLGFLLCACGAGLKGEYFVKDDVKYRVERPNASVWRRVGFAENDLAWVTERGHLLAMNSTCRDHGDPSLEVLTQHMLMGFSDKQLLRRRTFMLDGRDALESSYAAKLDGVPTEITVVVLKKDGCVHDFTYVAPLGHADEHKAELDALVDGFTTTDGPPKGRTATVRLGEPEIVPQPEAKAP
jgi:hypothetical protein